jgi:alpha-L-fucosidase 2
MKLWFAQPAEKWTDAMPVGNGTLGAMVFGRVSDERIQFNEATLWTGGPHDYANPKALAALPKIREMIASGDDKGAVALARSDFLSVPVRQKAFQPCGDLILKFAGQEGAVGVTGYRRELDLATGVARVTYAVGGVTYTRETFVSRPANVIVTRVLASVPGKVSFTAGLTTPHKSSEGRTLDAHTLMVKGKVQDPKTMPGDQAETFESRAMVTASGGTVEARNGGIVVTAADEAMIVLGAATSFVNWQDISGDPAARVEGTLEKAAGKTYEALREEHVKDFSPLMGRVALRLGDEGGAAAALPMDQRLGRVKNVEALAKDPGLAALYFQFGRYLLVSSSRPGGQPANLQGIWNEELTPPWESKFTTNINFEMNYWPAEVGNLTECMEPFFDIVDDLVASGRRTAKEHYGCRGWVLNHNTDLWRGTAPINNIDGVWPTGAAWLCHHLWEHYEFTENKAFLEKRAYPAMKEACLFFFDFLQKDPKTGWLISTPSFSPEQGSLCAGPSMDHQMIRDLMDNTVAAAKVLGINDAFTEELAKVRPQVAPDQIGKYRQLQEWLQDIDKPDNNHRHMSPLWCVFPGNEYTREDADPKFFNAAKVLLKWRGDGSTGWSYAWRMPLWARVGDGEIAYSQLAGLLAKRTLPSMLDLCGPFQIDGNFGAAAGIAEMLVQSHMKAPDARWEIDLLPALPKVWGSGEVTGLRARGGFTVDIAWQGGTVKRVAVTSALGNPVRVRVGAKFVDLGTERGKTYVLDGELKAK